MSGYCIDLRSDSRLFGSSDMAADLSSEKLELGKAQRWRSNCAFRMCGGSPRPVHAEPQEEPYISLSLSLSKKTMPISHECREAPHTNK